MQSKRDQQPASVNRLTETDSVAATTQSIERFVQCFEKSARRWEIVVYPAMFAFVVLAAYGFFLIYSLTTDMQRMSGSISHMSVTMEQMSSKLDTMKPMLSHLDSMDESMQVITMSNDLMRRDMNIMTHQVSRPMGFLNKFLPW